jgi:NADH-quinone oxidoreductase subunit K
MVSIPINDGLYLAAALFLLGLIGVLIRRNLLFMLMSLEIMLNATGLAFIVAGARWAGAEGQILFILILTLAAAEVAVGLALILLIHQHVRTLDADRISEMRN